MSDVPPALVPAREAAEVLSGLASADFAVASRAPLAREALDELARSGAHLDAVVMPLAASVTPPAGCTVVPYDKARAKWSLPAAMPRDLVLLDDERAWGLPFAAGALAAGVRRVVSFDGEAFRQEPIARVIARKLVAAAFARLGATPSARALEERLHDLRLPGALAGVEPILGAGAFVPGRVVLFNSSLAWGGAERQLVTTALGLLDRPEVESVTVVCVSLETADQRFYAPHLADSRVRVVELRNLPAAVRALRAHGGDAQARATQALRLLPATVREGALRVLAEILERRPEVVHCWQDAPSLTGGFASILAGVPRVVVASRSLTPQRFAYHEPFMRAAYRALASVRRIAWINNSRAGAAEYAEWLAMPVDRFRVVRNAVDAAAPAPAPSATALYRRDLGVPEGARIVGSVFRLHAEKSPLLWIDVAARVAAELPDVHFVVVGVGPLRAEVERRAVALGLRARLHLPGTMRDVSVAIASMDAFLLTSEFEGTPNVLLEAQLLGVPVIATAAGGAREAMDDGRTGWFVPERDPSKIAERVCAALTSPGWRAEAREAGPAFVRERFGLARMIAETIDVYGLSASSRRT